MTYTEKILEKKQDKLYPIARCAALMKYTVTHFIVSVNKNLQHTKSTQLWHGSISRGCRFNE